MSTQKTVMVGDVPFGGDNPIAFIMGPVSVGKPRSRHDDGRTCGQCLCAHWVKICL
jgi:hypothetical protein